MADGQRIWSRRFRDCLAIGFLVLAVLTAGSWVKSYWRSDRVRAGMTDRHQATVQDARGQIIVTVDWPGGGSGWVLEHSAESSRSRRPMPPVHGAFGFGYSRWEVLSNDGSIIMLHNRADTNPPVGFGLPDQGWDDLFIPHWFLLLLFAGGAWLFARPWLRRRSQGRGFEVVRMENSSGNDAMPPRPDNSVAP